VESLTLISELGIRIGILIATIIAMWFIYIKYLEVKGRKFSAKVKELGPEEILNDINNIENPLRNSYSRHVKQVLFSYFIGEKLVFLLDLLLIAMGLATMIFNGVGVLLILSALLSIFATFKGISKQYKEDFQNYIKLDRDKNGLYSLCDSIADEIQGPHFDSIYISPWDEAFVFETKERNKLEKNLVIGLGIMYNLTIDEIKVILAHEFGHFTFYAFKYGEDLKVIYKNISASIQFQEDHKNIFTYFNLNYYFCLYYYKFFLKSTGPYSKLNEYCADYQSVKYSGASICEQSYIKFTRQSIFFKNSLNQKIENFRDSAMRPKKINPYSESTLETPALEELIEKYSKESLTHPTLEQRLSFIEYMKKECPKQSRKEDKRFIHEILENYSEIEEQAIKFVTKRIRTIF